MSHGRQRKIVKPKGKRNPWIFRINSTMNWSRSKDLKSQGDRGRTPWRKIINPKNTNFSPKTTARSRFAHQKKQRGKTTNSLFSKEWFLNQPEAKNPSCSAANSHPVCYPLHLSFECFRRRAIDGKQAPGQETILGKENGGARKAYGLGSPKLAGIRNGIEDWNKWSEAIPTLRGLKLQWCVCVCVNAQFYMRQKRREREMNNFLV